MTELFSNGPPLRYVLQHVGRTGLRFRALTARHQPAAKRNSIGQERQGEPAGNQPRRGAGDQRFAIDGVPGAEWQGGGARVAGDARAHSGRRRPSRLPAERFGPDAQDRRRQDAGLCRARHSAAVFRRGAGRRGNRRPRERLFGSAGRHGHRPAVVRAAGRHDPQPPDRRLHHLHAGCRSGGSVRRRARPHRHGRERDARPCPAWTCRSKRR